MPGKLDITIFRHETATSPARASLSDESASINIRQIEAYDLQHILFKVIQQNR